MRIEKEVYSDQNWKQDVLPIRIRIENKIFYLSGSEKETWYTTYYD